MAITIKVNGADRMVNAGADLLQTYTLHEQTLVVKIVPRSVLDDDAQNSQTAQQTTVNNQGLCGHVGRVIRCQE